MGKQMRDARYYAYAINIGTIRQPFRAACLSIPERFFSIGCTRIRLILTAFRPLIVWRRWAPAAMPGRPGGGAAKPWISVGADPDRATIGDLVIYNLKCTFIGFTMNPQLRRGLPESVAPSRESLRWVPCLEPRRRGGGTDTCISVRCIKNQTRVHASRVLRPRQTLRYAEMFLQSDA